MLRILENLVTDLKLSYFMNEKFSQNIAAPYVVKKLPDGISGIKVTSIKSIPDK